MAKVGKGSLESLGREAWAVEGGKGMGWWSGGKGGIQWGAVYISVEEACLREKGSLSFLWVSWLCKILHVKISACGGQVACAGMCGLDGPSKLYI